MIEHAICVGCRTQIEYPTLFSRTGQERTCRLVDAKLATLASLSMIECFVQGTNIISEFSRNIQLDVEVRVDAQR